MMLYGYLGEIDWTKRDCLEDQKGFNVQIDSIRFLILVNFYFLDIGWEQKI